MSQINVTTEDMPDVSDRSLASYRPALRKLGVVICRSLFLPLFLGAAAWELRDSFDTRTLSGAMSRAGFLLLPLVILTVFLHQSLQQGGLVKRFYKWSGSVIKGLRNCTFLIFLFALPLKFLYLALQTFEEGRFSDSLGRMFFVGSMVSLSVGLWIAVFDFRRWRKNEDSEISRWLVQIFSWAFVAAALVSLAICGMSLFGYHYGAEQLGWRLMLSVLVGILLAVATGFASHMMLVTQYKVQLRRLYADGSEEDSYESDAIDVAAISFQVNRLLSVTALVAGVVLAWQVWGTVFPANSYLDLVRLWQGPLNDAGELTWVTLRHVLTSIGVITLTVVLSRNLPGLLEITLLDRLQLDRGGRYAIGFVLRYVVGIVGTIWAFQLLGFSWKSLQWLAAGLTVGLGFGLQEIFANLISGIIILIERPVRVGDFVTVNGTSGTVTRMQLRATTIQDLDHRELIVPNKKFITEDVMNWTLTEKYSRAIFPVGVAYASDTKKVEEILLQVANENRLVLKEPKPVVVFSEFGDSVLNFELRVHIPHWDFYPQVQHEINMRIDAMFRQNGIEIAFPQQDLHIRSGEIRLAPQTVDETPGQGIVKGSIMPTGDLKFDSQSKTA